MSPPVATAPAGKTTPISGAPPPRNRPPSLAICINKRQPLVDRVARGDAELGPGKTLPTVEQLEYIAAAIAGQLSDDSFVAVWDVPEGRHPNPADQAARDPLGIEERWARLVDELFLGCMYSGPDIVAAFPSKGKYKSPELSMGYLYGRFSIEDGAPVADPAYSVAVACQHLVTYGALARGVSMKELGGRGIAASQSTSLLPVFAGRWYASGGFRLVNANKPEPNKWITAGHAFSAAYLMGADTKRGKVEGHDEDEIAGFGPGAVYTFNPMSYQRHVIGRVRKDQLVIDKKTGQPILQDGLPVATMAASRDYMFDEQEKVEQQSKEGVPTDVKTQTAQDGHAAQAEAKKAGQAALDPDSGAAREVPQSDLEVAQILTSTVQLEGSHAAMVLRTYKTEEGAHAIQMFDSAAHAMAAGNVAKVSAADISADYVMFMKSQLQGIFAGEASATAQGSQKNFVGLGLLPPISSHEAVFQLLESARPVGLARLVLALRKPALDEDDILWASPMIRTWSDDGRNFPISRLLWSLRVSPLFRSVQPYWIVYAPRGCLAETMWEAGARNKSLDDLVKDALERFETYKMKETYKGRLRTGRDLIACAVLSEDAEGHAIHMWRDHGTGGQGEAPGPIKRVFVQTGQPDMVVLNREIESRRAKLNAKSHERNAEINRRAAEIKALSKQPPKAPYEPPSAPKPGSAWDTWYNDIQAKQKALDDYLADEQPRVDAAAFQDYVLNFDDDANAPWFIRVRNNPQASGLSDKHYPEDTSFDMPDLFAS